MRLSAREVIVACLAGALMTGAMCRRTEDLVLDIAQFCRENPHECGGTPTPTPAPRPTPRPEAPAQ